MSSCPVVIPNPEHPIATLIIPGSGIVTASTPGAGDERVSIDYEGNKFSSANIVTFADRVLHAHGRMVAAYPTVARMTVPQDAIVHVGTYDDTDGAVTPLDDSAAVLIAEWIGVKATPEMLDAELLCTGLRHQERRALTAMIATHPHRHDPALRAELRRHAQRTGNTDLAI